MSERRRFPADPASVAAARRFTGAVLHGGDPAVLESVALMVSELATNAICHAGVGFEVRIERRRSGVRVEVQDTGSGDPHLRNPRPEDDHGRGLRIVDMLAARWGVEPGRRAGKTVWFELPDATRDQARSRSARVTSSASPNSERRRSAAPRSSTRMRSASCIVSGSPARSATLRSSS